MRLVQVAKVLGMTGQQLRKELLQVDFGIKPTDREIPDNLAHGIVRFIARKHNITLPPNVLTTMVMDDEENPAQGAPAAEGAVPIVSEEASLPPENLNVLRKLTLEDVPKEAIRREEQRMTTAPQHATSYIPGARPPRPRRDAPVRRAPREQVAQEQIKRKEGTVHLPGAITVKEFSEKVGVQVPKVVQALLKNGVLATINQTIDFDTAAIVAADLGVTVARQEEVRMEDILATDLSNLLKDDPQNLVARPPVVVVMGHVDHGKTSLLDAIRKADVAAHESGGITQHIGAYQVHHLPEGKDASETRLITFLDTPGHEAFTAMRARGAQLTDIAILVVSAEDGVRETTVEAIAHAREAEVPILVAISKIDSPRADLERVKGELAGHGLQPEEWGGTTPVVPYSAMTKQGVPEILEHVLLLAEIEDLKANPNRRAVATVVESHLHPSLGPLATLVVNTGTLKAGDPFVCGRTIGKVRAMLNGAGDRIDAAPPSCPVQVTGFGDVPRTGDILQVVSSDREAKELLHKVTAHEGQQQRRVFADLVSRLHEGKQRQLKVILKTDAQGSLEAIQSSLDKQSGADVTVKVIHAAAGAVSENDVMMASASGALVIAFRVPVSTAVQRTAEREGVRIREYDVIYTIFDEVSGLLEGLLVPEEQEKVLGHLEVKGVFLTKKTEQIIGGRVTDGLVKRVSFRLVRAGNVVGTGRILSLRKVDADVKEIKEGSECGMRVESTVPVAMEDVLEVFVKEFKKKGE